MTEREKDLLLYGCYIEVAGKRVDPLTVSYERAPAAAPVGESLIETVLREQKEAGARKPPPQ